MREVVRFQDAYHFFQKVLSGLLVRLTCSFLKLALSLCCHYLFINIFRKTGLIIKDTCFSENDVSGYHLFLPREILGQIVIEMSSGKLKLHNLEGFIFKILVLNPNYSKASIKHFYVIPMWQRVFSFPFKLVQCDHLQRRRL